MKIYDSKLIDQSIVNIFCAVTKDTNPLHYDVDYCLKTHFKKPIVPGAMLVSLLHKLIAEHFPGAVIMQDNMRYLAPVFVNKRVEIEITIHKEREFLHIISCDKKEVLLGESQVYMKYANRS